MNRAVDVIVIGAGVQGASLAFHLARKSARVLVVERGVIAGEATGRSSGFVRMHYDLAAEAALAWRSFPYFLDWAGHVGAGDPGFVRTGFLEVLPARHEAALRGNVANQQALGIDTHVVTPAEIAELVPGIVLDGIAAGAWEPRSGYADPTSTAAGFLEAARRLGAEVITGSRVDGLLTDGDRVVGVDTDMGIHTAAHVAIAAGAWSATLAATVGVEIPVTPWRHETGYFGLPDGSTGDLPVVLDDVGGVYWRPEGRELLLVGLHASNELGGSPDRPVNAVRASSVEDMTARLVHRLPWMAAGTYRTGHGGQDGITPDQRAILGAAGPDGLVLVCGFSGTGFKTAPAIGSAMADLILDGATSVDLAPFAPDRFAADRPTRGEHPYEALWR